MEILLSILIFLWGIILFLIKVIVYIIGFFPMLLIRVTEWLSIMPNIWPFPTGFY